MKISLIIFSGTFAVCISICMRKWDFIVEEMLAEDGEILDEVWYPHSMDTAHLSQRADRLEKIRTLIGYGNDVCENIVDRGHPAGPELFVLTDTGIIRCYNARTHRHITDLIARTRQIYDRLGSAFSALPFTLRKKIIDLADMHEARGWNNW